MIASQSLYLTADRKVVPEGHKDARSLLVRQGSEIPDSHIDRYPGAAELLKKEAVQPKAREAFVPKQRNQPVHDDDDDDSGDVPEVTIRKPHTKNRDPRGQHKR